MRRTAGWALAGTMALAGCGADPAPATAPPAAPSPSAAAPTPDFAVVVDEALAVPGSRRFPDSAVLAGPGPALRVTEAGTASELDQTAVQQVADAGAVPAGSAVPLPAGDGHEFLIARLAALPARTDLAHIVPTPIELRLGPAKRTVKLDSEAAPHRHADRTLLARVPVGAPAEARITVGGRTQVVDLRTGKGTGQIPAYARHLPSGSADVETWAAGNAMSAEADVDVSLEPYAGRWAAPGRAWLNIGLDITVRNWNGAAVLGDLDLDRSLRITVDGRTRTGSFGTEALSPVDMVADASQLSTGVRVEVPAGGVRSVTVRLAPKGSLEVRGKPVTFVPAHVTAPAIKLR